MESWYTGILQVTSLVVAARQTCRLHEQKCHECLNYGYRCLVRHKYTSFAIVWTFITVDCGHSVGSRRWINHHKAESNRFARSIVLGTRPKSGCVAAVSQIADQ